MGKMMSVANIGFGLALAILVGIALLSYDNTRNLAEIAARRQAALERLDELLGLLTVAVDIETGMRGYVVTGDSKFLEPYHSGLDRLDLQLQRIGQGLDDPARRDALAAIEEALYLLREHDRQVVALKMDKDDEAARQAVGTGFGKMLMDQIRVLISSWRDEERRRLAAGDERYQTGLRRTLFIIALGSLMGIGAVVLAALTLHRRLRERSRLNRELSKSLAENIQTFEHLRAAAADLRRSNEELEQFAYVASHDLQEPLRKVSSFAQLLGSQYKGKLDADADEFIGYMVDGANRMQILIQNLLAFSRIGRGAKPFLPVDANAVLAEALANLQEATEESGATVTSAGLPTVFGNQSHLVQLFQNLIGNAIKFHGVDPPAIEIRAAASGSWWTFSLSDNGIGIDPVFAERIFLIFQRLHTREEYSGTGIGLAICKKIVERHGGKIWLDDPAGRGATFCFTLPQSPNSSSSKSQVPS